LSACGLYASRSGGGARVHLVHLKMDKRQESENNPMASILSTSQYTQLASEQQIEKTVQALQANGIRVVVFETGEEASTYVLDLIPDGAEVYNSPSRTLEVL